jgi:hypothetical protein
VCRERAQQFRRIVGAIRERDIDAPGGRGRSVREARVGQPFVQQASDVQVGDGDRGVEAEPFRLGEQCAVLGDEGVPAEHDVHRALAWPGAGVEVRRETAGGLLADEVDAVVRLAEQLW